jgi:hypothetical protein
MQAEAGGVLSLPRRQESALLAVLLLSAGNAAGCVG